MNRRKVDRFTCYAKAFIKRDGNPGYVRDINDSGCQIEIIDGNEYALEQKLEITIIPDEDLHIPPFEISMTIKWLEIESNTIKIGGVFSVLSKYKEDLKKLVELFNE